MRLLVQSQHISSSKLRADRSRFGALPGHSTGLFFVNLGPTLASQQIDKTIFSWGQLPYGSSEGSVLSRHVAMLTGLLLQIFEITQQLVILPILILELLCAGSAFSSLCKLWTRLTYP